MKQQGEIKYQGSKLNSRGEIQHLWKRINTEGGEIEHQLRKLRPDHWIALPDHPTTRRLSEHEEGRLIIRQETKQQGENKHPARSLNKHQGGRLDRRKIKTPREEEMAHHGRSLNTKGGN